MAAATAALAFVPSPPLSTRGYLTELGETVDDRVDVVGALGQHETDSARGDSLVYVVADLVGALAILHDRAEHRLDRV